METQTVFWDRPKGMN